MLKTKREQRIQALRDWVPKWDGSEEFVFYGGVFCEQDSMGGIVRIDDRSTIEKLWADPANRDDRILDMVDRADRIPEYAYTLDRFLEIPTEAEVSANQAGWGTIGVKWSIVISGLAFLVSVTALYVAYLAWSKP